MRAELVAIGDELLYGDIINGNAAWLGQRLAEVGVDLSRSGVVGDSEPEIAALLTEALGRADVVITTGGLGPTQDDLTREGLARAAGVGLSRDDFLEAQLRRRLRAARVDVPDMNFRQADLPAGATPLPNERGTAPGLRLELLGGVAYALPGPPAEMQPMFTASVLPDLLRRGGEPAVVVHRVLRTAGMWESSVAEALAPLELRLRSAGGNPGMAFLASGGQTRVRLTVKARTRNDAEVLLQPLEAEAVSALGPGYYGRDDATLEGTLLSALRERGATLAVAESLSGGLLAGRLTDTPGASDVVLGGVVAYATRLKTELLGVDAGALARDGAVAAGTAEAMARGVRERLGTDFGLSLTGVAGPAEQEGHPAGTVFIGLARADGSAVSRQLRLPGTREQIREFSVVSACDLLRRDLAGDLPDTYLGPTRV